MMVAVPELPKLLISRFQVRVLGGSLSLVPPAMAPGGAMVGGDGIMPATIVTWTVAPDWLTPGDAARLLGPAYSEAAILALINIGALVAEEDDAGGWLVEKRGLREYRDALWEVLTDGQD